jgi:cytochrome c oxidase subunit III
MVNAATQTPAESAASHERRGHGHHAPITAGKVAMWLFLATEVMFFTGLIGSYIVLRSGSSIKGYTNLYSPASDLTGLENTYGLLLKNAGGSHSQVAEAIHAAGVATDAAEKAVHEAPHGLITNLSKEKAEALHDQLHALGAEAELEPLVMHNWPKPYDELTNPLSIDLTAANTFVLICSSVTMVLALGAIQQGKKSKCTAYLLATVLIGSCFLGVQVYEYYQLMFGHHYPPGISATGHFRPDVSLFASCFFTMTGFHGAHVTGGVILLFCIFVKSLMGGYSQANHSSVELAGLYWHFVDLVWIILFTIVYLV